MLDSKNTNHDHDHTQNRFAVIPTLEKLAANAAFRGSRVRIAFIDSGFYPHPDFAERVVAFHDIADEEKLFSHIVAPKSHHWHGTQTVASCAGDGGLSNGRFRGLACESELVLVKASRNGRIGDAEIEAGLQWIIENRERLSIRVLNMSLGGDCDLPSEDSRINSLVEELIAAGVVVVVAAGNSAEMRSLPPASAPSAVTVGGFSDGNKLTTDARNLYHSSFGKTADGLIKPELIAPSMYVAVPILPGTADYEIAEMLSLLDTAPDYSFRSLLESFWEAADLDADILDQSDNTARQMIERRLRTRKVISTHYQHADGTSFAAPITASVVAQMLEANPTLTPAAVKNILVSTASRLSGHPALRQGFGIINADAAVDLAKREFHTLAASDFHAPRVSGNMIVFTYHDDNASRVALAGDFNRWNRAMTPLELGEDGIWRVSIPLQAPGPYRYKFLVDDAWREDPSHSFKEEDGFGGFNSLLIIASEQE